MLLKRILAKSIESRTANELRYVAILEPFHETDTEKLWAIFQATPQEDIDFVMQESLHHSFFQFLSSEIQFFNQYSRKHKRVSSELWGLSEWTANLGIIEVPKDDKETPYLYSVKVGDEVRKFRFSHNNTNRGYSDTNASRYSKFMVQRRWADNGETIIYDHTGEAASVQHRGGAAHPACLADGTLKIPVTVVRGIPRQLVGSIETGRKRTKKDETSRFKEILWEVVKPLGGMPSYGGKQLVHVTKVNSEMTSAIDAILLRVHGKDVHNSTTGIDSDSHFDFIERAPDFPRLVALCYAHWEGNKNSYEPYSPAQLATALLLFSNQDNPSEREVIPGNGRKKFDWKIELPDFIDVDMEFAENFLASIKLGWVSALTSHLTNKAVKAKYKKNHKMQALVNSIKYFKEHGHSEEVPPPVDPATGEVAIDPLTKLPYPLIVRWNCPPLASHGMAPVRDDKTWEWSPFGGLDCGKLPDPANHIDVDKMM